MHEETKKTKQSVQRMYTNWSYSWQKKNQWMWKNISCKFHDLCIVYTLHKRWLQKCMSVDTQSWLTKVVTVQSKVSCIFHGMACGLHAKTYMQCTLEFPNFVELPTYLATIKTNDVIWTNYLQLVCVNSGKINALEIWHFDEYVFWVHWQLRYSNILYSKILSFLKTNYMQVQLVYWNKKSTPDGGIVGLVREGRLLNKTKCCETDKNIDDFVNVKRIVCYSMCVMW